MFRSPVRPIWNVFDRMMCIRCICMLVVGWVVLRWRFVLKRVQRRWCGRRCGRTCRWCGGVFDRSRIRVRRGTVRGRRGIWLRGRAALSRAPIGAAASPRITAAAICYSWSRTLCIVVRGCEKNISIFLITVELLVKKFIPRSTAISHVTYFCH